MELSNIREKTRYKPEYYSWKIPTNLTDKTINSNKRQNTTINKEPNAITNKIINIVKR